MTSPLYRVAVILLLGALVLGAYGVISGNASVTHRSSDYTVLKRSWESRFAQEGTRQAFEAFIAEGHGVPYERSHMMAHVVGAILYDQEGLNGISLCSEDFGYGCFHGFAGRIIEQEGSAGIGRFAHACQKSAYPEACEHGIGHGLLAYLSDDELIAALDLCPAPPAGGIRSCYNGVFMEYFFNTLRRDDGLTLRPMDQDSPEGPCQSEVPETYQNACYYELPAWWRAHASLRGASYSEQFTDVSLRCARLGKRALRSVCYAGAGAQIAAFSGNDSDAVQDLCALMGETGTAICAEEATRAGTGIESTSRR